MHVSELAVTGKYNCYSHIERGKICTEKAITWVHE